MSWSNKNPITAQIEMRDGKPFVSINISDIEWVECTPTDSAPDDELEYP